MNLLVVDDDISSVDCITSMVDRQKLGINEIFSAYDIESAKEIFKTHTVELLLCDIEMPCGSGLDFIEWIKENNFGTVCIILTSYAKFLYAKRALELGSFGYILKPAPYPEIESQLEKAIEKARETQNITDSLEAAEHWNQNKTIVIEQFFRELINGDTAMSIEELAEHAKNKSINLYRDSTYTPILIQIELKKNGENEWDRESLTYAIKNMASEVVFQNDADQFFVPLDQYSFVIILRDFTHTERNIDSLKYRCDVLRKHCDVYLSVTSSCYIGLSVSANLIGSETHRLKCYAASNVSDIGGSFVTTSDAGKPAPYHSPEKQFWQNHFIHGEISKTIEVIYKYLDSMASTEKISIEKLRHFKYDFFQSLCLVLDGLGIKAHLLFSDSESEKLFRESSRSISSMKQYIQHAITKSGEFISHYHKPQTLVEEIEKYIQENYDKNITRETIAEEFFFTSDYINRLFKKKNGVTVSKYIFDTRIAHAKELLSETQLSIGEISDRTGFSYITYFSQAFKKETGMSPVEYRNSFES